MSNIIKTKVRYNHEPIYNMHLNCVFIYHFQLLQVWFVPMVLHLNENKILFINIPPLFHLSY